MKFPYFHLQLWDRDILKWNDCAGEGKVYESYTIETIEAILLAYFWPTFCFLSSAHFVYSFVCSSFGFSSYLIFGVYSCRYDQFGSLLPQSL